MSQISVDEDVVVLAGLSVRDSVLASLVRNAGSDEAAEDLIADALEIGARVLVRETVGADVDYLQAELGRMAEQLVATLAGHFAAADGRNPLNDFKEGAIEAIRQMGGSIAEQLAAVVERSARVEAAVAALQTQAGAAEELKAERERGTAKGRRYEEAVVESVATLATLRGDVCEGVGDTAGVGGKTGDVVVDVEAASGPTRGRIVFEAKTGRLSRPEMMRELDRAMEVRDADFAVLVVRDEQVVPARVAPLQEYDGNKMVAVLAAGESTLILQTAYALARARVLMGATGEEIDSVAVTEAAQRALQALDELRMVKSRLTAAAGDLNSASNLLDMIAGQVRREIQQLAELT